MTAIPQATDQPLSDGQPPTPGGAEPTLGRSDWRDEERLLVDLAAALHECGASSYDLEDSILACAERLGRRVEVFSSPTSIFLSFDYGGHDKTTMARMRPGGIDLGKLTDVHQLIGGLSNASIPQREARERLDAIRRRPGATAAATVLSFGAACGTAAGFFGGGVREAVVAAVVGLVIGLLSVLLAGSSRLRRVAQPLCAAVAAMLAACGATLMTPVSIEIVTLSSLIVLIPGLSLTTAISELAQEHLAAGASRLMGSLVQLLSIGFGVALGRALASQVMELPVQQPAAMPTIGFWACLLIAPFSFVVLFQARWRDAAWILLTCVTAFGAARWGQEAFGAELGAAFGAFTLGVLSNLLSWMTGKPAPALMAPALLILVPGSVGFRAVQAFVDHQTVAAMQSAFSAMFVAVALVAGLLVADVVAHFKTTR